MDEVGRGTSVRDGLAIAFAVVRHLYFKNSCRALFATHFHELSDMLGCTEDYRGAGPFGRIGFFCTDVQETEVKRPLLTYRIFSLLTPYPVWLFLVLTPPAARCEQGKPRTQSCPVGRDASICGRCCSRGYGAPEV